MNINIKEILSLPKNRVKVQIPVAGDAYQAYLASERAIEAAREEFGFVPPELYQHRQEAVSAAVNEGKNLRAS